MTYPLTPKSIASDEYFGTEVLDPYRWMEDDTSQVTAEWTEEENKTTFAFLDKIPFRPLLRKRLDELFNYERMGAPDKQGAYYYYYLNDGLQNHSVLYRKENLREKKGEVFLDPNTFSKDGTTKLSGISFSKDGSRAGYLVSKGGA
ncbi:MAG: S9 family peptidase, partial [Candidatus Nephrothrix sp. EaCA]